MFITMKLGQIVARFHGLLELSWGYSLLMRLSGAGVGRRIFFSQHAGIPPESRVLEIGCGPGTNVEYMPRNTHYTGCDSNPRYIESAKRRYPNKGTFLRLSAEEMLTVTLDEFDVVLVISVLHHLADHQVRAMNKGAFRALRTGGYLLVWEPCWRDGQSWLDRFMLSMDRGRHVRTMVEYARLLQETFDNVESEFLMTPRMLWPQSGCVLRAQKR